MRRRFRAGGSAGTRGRAAGRRRDVRAACRPRVAPQRAARGREGVWATAGVHPHDAKDGWEGIEALLSEPEVVAVGECGLDYHYDRSPREAQREVFRRLLWRLARTRRTLAQGRERNAQ